MTDDDIIEEFKGFDPEHDPETQEEANRYVRWCGHAYEGLIASTERPTYKEARVAAAMLWVVSVSQLHLDDAITGAPRSPLLGNLARLVEHARGYERGRETNPHWLSVARGVLDLMDPVGPMAELVLDAAKCAVSATILIAAHPPVEDLWVLPAKDVWVLCATGGFYLDEIPEDPERTYQDFAITFSERTLDAMNWQRAQNITSQAGAPPLSQN